ncbi:MAG: T9SS type A sorting domain-containing protein, partial [Flavobacteriales bacterium]
TLCPDETATLSVPDQFDSYQWWHETVGGGLYEAIDGETMATLDIDVNNAGQDIWCEVTLDGCTEASNSMTINAYIFEATQVTANAASICENDSVVLTVTGADGVVEWLLDGNPTGAADYSYISYDPGTYSAIIYPTQCPNYAIESGDGPTVVVNPLPTPEITVTDNVNLSTDEYADYQWYADGTLITDADMQTYTATEDGAYAVLVTDDNGCSATSSSFGVTVSNLNELDMQAMSLYPIPAQNFLIIETQTPGVAYITDLAGRMISSQQVNVSQKIDISTLESGTYLMILNEQVIRWMKE